MNKKLIKITILLLFIFSYVFLFIKLFSLPKTECILEENEKLYKKEQSILLKHSKNTVIEIIKKETVTSSIQHIIDIKQDEYKKKEYSITRRENTIRAFKKEKVKEEYNEVLKTLTKEGYKCMGD